MAQIFKAKILVSNTGRFSNEVTAPNLVYNTGDQSISGAKNFYTRPTVNGTGVLLIGESSPAILPDTIVYTTGNQNISQIKNFYSRPTVNGTGVLLIGEASSVTLPNTIVYTTGNQTISGNKNFVENVIVGDQNQDNLFVVSGNQITFGVNPTVNGTGIVYTQGDQTISGTKTFDVAPILSGSPFITGIDLSSYVTTGQTGVFYPRNNPSGFITGVDLSSYVTTGQTGVFYPRNNPSGFITGVDLSSYATTTNLNLTGLNLSNSINSLSGTLTGNYATKSNGQFTDRPTVNGTGVLLSGEASNVTLPNTIVYTTGDQTISGNKTFNNTLSVGTISGLSVPYGTPSINIKGLNNGTDLGGLFAGGYVQVIGGSGNNGGGNVSILGGDDSSRKYGGIINLIGGQVNINNDNTLSRTVTIYKTGEFGTANNIKISQNSIDINNNFYISGEPVLPSSYATNSNLFTTGSILNNKSNALSGYINSQDIIFSGQTFNTGSRLDNKINSLSGYVDSKSIVLPTTIVYTTGNQTVSGIKTFANNLEVQGTGIFNALDLSNISEFNFSGTNINLINGNINISGGTLYISGNAVLTGVNLNAYATTANLFATGSNLDNKLNSLSGYINSQDILFSGQTALTGSNLNDKINSLSGYLNSQDVIFSGQTFNTGSRLNSKIDSLSGYVDSKSIVLPTTIIYSTGDQTISGIKTFAQTGSFNTLQITNKKLSSYNYVNSNFTFSDIYINIANSSSNIIGTLPSGITSGIHYYVKNLNTGILSITGSGQRTIDGFSNINLYKNESLQLFGVNNIGYTGWITIGEGIGVS